MKPLKKLLDTTYINKIPLFCTFELTKNCNLNCLHCYLDDKSPKDGLNTQEVKKALRELKKLGLLYLVFTGGEVFLRRDFLDLCSYARKLKFDLRIFTNGLLVTDKIAEQLSTMNLSGIEISFYGRKSSHEAITGSSGSFEKTQSAIQLLRKHNIPVTIKCPLMKINFKDYSWLKAFADKYVLKLRVDPTIGPKNSGDQNILTHRLKTNQLKKLYRDEYFNTAIDIPKNESDTDSLFCSAGHNLLAIDSSGEVYPCLQLPVSIGNIKNNSLSKIWSINNKILENLRKTTLEDITDCRSCNLIKSCQRCPGLALLEDGDLYGSSKIACQIAEVTKNTY